MIGLLVSPLASLRSRLLLLFAVAVALVLAIHLAVRHWFELPALYAQEHANDVAAVQAIRRLLDAEQSRMRELLIDNGHWDDAREFVLTEKHSARYQTFVQIEFSYPETMHGVLRIDGYEYLGRQAQPVFSSRFDTQTLEPLPDPALPTLKLISSLADTPGLVRTGFIGHDGHVLLVGATGITGDEAKQKPAGFLLLWRVADAEFFAEVLRSAPVSFEPVDRGGALLQQIRSQPAGVTARDGDGVIHWVVDDMWGNPLLVAHQSTSPRAFFDGVVAPSTLFATAGLTLLLLLIAALVSRWVVNPVLALAQFSHDVAERADFSRRATPDQRSEIGRLATSINEMLQLVETKDAELRERNKALTLLSERDPLTGAGNRRAFEQIIERDWLHAQRSGTFLSCLMVDIDYFKNFNDSYGHPEGDEALKKVAGALQATLRRAVDALFRYGGEEFVVLLVETDPDGAMRIAQELLRAVAALQIPHNDSRCSGQLTISIGVASRRPRATELTSDLVREADQALYLAKKQGRNQVVVSAPRLVRDSVTA